jgi:hypothetical protein
MTPPDIQMENIKPVEFIPMSPAETAALRELTIDMMYAKPRTAEPVITQGNRTLRYIPADPHCVTLEWEDNPNALYVLFLYAPDWLPWHNGKWTPPPDAGCWAEYGDDAVFRKKDTH